MRKKTIIHLTILLSIIIMSGCTTAYKVTVDERKIETIKKDEIIEAKLLKALADDEDTKVFSISATSLYGVIYMAGEYENDKQKQKTLNIAKSIEGVKSVKHYLLPKKEIEGCSTKDNLKIMASIKKKLIGDSKIKSTNVKYKVMQCKVIVWGLLGSRDEINKTIKHIKSVENIKGVKSFFLQN